MKERKSSRAILIKNNSIFLFQFHFAMLQDDKTLWVTLDGKVEEGETYGN